MDEKDPTVTDISSHPKWSDWRLSLGLTLHKFHMDIASWYSDCYHQKLGESFQFGHPAEGDPELGRRLLVALLWVFQSRFSRNWNEPLDFEPPPPGVARGLFA